MNYLGDICQSEPSLFKKYFDQLLVLMQQVRKMTDDPESSLKSQSLECLILIIERFPKFAKSKIERL